MTKDTAEPENAGLLHALGQAEPPGPDVLEAARERLWSVVAADVPSADPGNAGQTSWGGTQQPRKDIRRHQAEPGA